MEKLVLAVRSTGNHPRVLIVQMKMKICSSCKTWRQCLRSKTGWFCPIVNVSNSYMLALRGAVEDTNIFWYTTAEKAEFEYSSNIFTVANCLKSDGGILGLRVNLSYCQNQDITIKMLISHHSCFNYLKPFEFEDCGSINWQIFS